MASENSGIMVSFAVILLLTAGAFAFIGATDGGDNEHGTTATLGNIPAGAIPVSSAADLARVGTGQSSGGHVWSLGAYYYQTTDITLTGLFTPIGVLMSGNPAVPGNSPFTGTYDGQYFRIFNMAVTTTGSSTNQNVAAAMFNNISGATIKGVNLVNANIIGGLYGAGGIAAYALNSTITDCTVSGLVSRNYTGSNTGGAVKEAGGIVAVASNVTIERCVNYATVHHYAGTSGGIAGRMDTNGFLTINQSANHGSVTSNMNSSATGLGSVSGGIVGTAAYSSSSVLTIRDCYNAGNISSHNASSSTGGNPASGGILGGIQLAGGSQTIINCYNVGTITSNRSNQSGNALGSGGIIGMVDAVNNNPNPSVVNCYSLQGTVYRYGVLTDALIGRGTGTTDGSSSPARLTNPNQSSGIRSDSLMKPSQAGAVAGSSVYYAGTTNGSIPGWNFTSVWIIDPSLNNGYPRLRAVEISITSSPSNTAVIVGDTFTYTPTVSMSPAQISVSGASWLSVNGSTVVGTPTVAGTYTVTVTATVGSKTATQTFTITVHAKLAFQSMPTGSILISPAQGVLA